MEAVGQGACAAGGRSTGAMGLVWKQLSPTDLNRGYLLRLGAGSRLFGLLVSAVVGSDALQPAASGGASGAQAPAGCHSSTAVREQLNLPVKLVPEGCPSGRFQVGADWSRMAARWCKVLHGKNPQGRDCMLCHGRCATGGTAYLAAANPEYRCRPPDSSTYRYPVACCCTISPDPSRASRRCTCACRPRALASHTTASEVRTWP